MNVNTRESQEVGEQFDERDIRALNEHITVVPTYDGTGDVEGISPTTTYRIDTETLEGSCPDAQYNVTFGSVNSDKFALFSDQLFRTRICLKKRI